MEASHYMALTTSSPLVQPRRAEYPEPGSSQFCRELLVRARRGDSIAFARLFDLYSDRVYDYLFFNLGDEQAAEDLTACVFLKAWRTLGCYEPEREPFDVWLYGVTRSRLIDFVHTHRASLPIKDILSPTDSGFAPSEAAAVPDE